MAAPHWHRNDETPPLSSGTGAFPMLLVHGVRVPRSFWGQGPKMLLLEMKK